MAKLGIFYRPTPPTPPARIITSEGAHAPPCHSPFPDPLSGVDPMSTSRPTDHAAQTPKSGHEANGQFAKGNKGGPGTPSPRQVAQLRKVIINRVTEEDLLAITEALLAKAKEGSVGAAKLLLSYALGKPASAPDPDRLDGQE